jgi:hypothetical protein
MAADARRRGSERRVSSRRTVLILEADAFEGRDAEKLAGSALEIDLRGDDTHERIVRGHKKNRASADAAHIGARIGQGRAVKTDEILLRNLTGAITIPRRRDPEHRGIGSCADPPPGGIDVAKQPGISGYQDQLPRVRGRRRPSAWCRRDARPDSLRFLGRYAQEDDVPLLVVPGNAGHRIEGRKLADLPV